MSRRFWAGMLAVGVLVCWSLAPPAVAGCDLLVTFHRTGGIAGVDDAMTIDRDGAVRVERTGSSPEDFRLPSEEVATLEEELDAADFEHLERDYDNPQIRDGYNYEVTYEGRAVGCAQGAGPPALRKAISHLEEIMDHSSG